MEVLNVLNKDLIFLNKNFDEVNQLFDFIGMKAKALNLAKSSYGDALKKRESEFPTALEFNNLGVAIPHADSEHLTNEFISLVTLDKPIKFRAMEDENKEIDVSIVFILGLQKANDQLATLQAIVELLQEEETLKYISKASSADEVLSKLKNG
ncbi:PTS sugar transporter subunit IIA [Tetragenococcus halophilus]|uniref:PTS sugar transporter subunit IIA n=1 Tax=Tetragenococcus halophilus TaxID=51669 RepID=UPI0015BC66F9|nr:PTS sugar transporter subunit IIA [Tetragenococcus halophilus]NWN99653.1 PTS sugar transporter subunit IIA [Tetragenococcus halophilus]